MEDSISLIESIQNSHIPKEKTFADSIVLNKYLLNNKIDYVLLVNIRSLNKNFSKLTVFIENLEVKPTIIVCTETWSLDYDKIFTITGYKLYYNESKINKADGVVMYISEKINETTEIQEFSNLKILCTKIKLENNQSLNLAAIYRCHDLSESDFIFNLKKYIHRTKNIKNHLILGDFNIDILKNNCSSQEHLNNLLENGFHPGFIGITRPSDHAQMGSCIDNIFIKANNRLQLKPFKLTNTLNDHYSLFISLSKIKCNSKTTNKVIINYKELKKVAQKQNWNGILSIHDSNTATTTLIETIQFCLKSSTKNINKRKHDKQKPRSSWITKGIITSCIKKEKLYKAWDLDRGNLQLLHEYKSYEKILNKVILDAKLLHDKKLIYKNKSDPKKLWNTINGMLGKTKKSDDNIDYIMNVNDKLSNPIDICNAMNDYYINVSDELCNKIQQPLNETLRLPPNNNKSIYFFPTNTDEVTEIINRMKIRNGGVDGINTTTIRILSEFIKIPLVHIINTSITQGVWPNTLKCAEVKPIHKSGDKSIVSNYRPISLISNLAKIFERIIFNRIFKFCNKHKILSNNQFGFIKNRGTKDALNKLTNYIVDKIDKKEAISVAFLDLAKAFDTVNHSILLMKLNRYGIRGLPNKLLESYLKNRQQRVKINGHQSQFKTVTSGVPQGTILGPLLFILYINDLLNNLPEDAIFSYADDTVIVSTNKKWSIVEQQMNEYLSKVSIWLALNKLSLNIDKSVYINFGSYSTSTPKNLNIHINDIQLKQVEKYKYLGIMFDSNLKWDAHIEYLLNKTRYLTYIFSKLSKVMTTDTLTMIYYAFFNSVIDYGIIAWGGAYGNQLNALQRLQCRLLKLVNKNMFFDSKNPLNLRQLFTLNAIIYHYDVLVNTYINSSSITRHRPIQLPIYNKRIMNKSSYFMAIKIFNVLPQKLKTLRIRNRKKQLKKWISNNESKIESLYVTKYVHRTT